MSASEGKPDLPSGRANVTPGRHWMFGRIFGLDGQDSYRELRLERLCCPHRPTEELLRMNESIHGERTASCGRPVASRGVLSFSLRSPLTEPSCVINIAYRPFSDMANDPEDVR